MSIARRARARETPIFVKPRGSKWLDREGFVRLPSSRPSVGGGGPSGGRRDDNGDMICRSRELTGPRRRSMSKFRNCRYRIRFNDRTPVQMEGPRLLLESLQNKSTMGKTQLNLAMSMKAMRAANHARLAIGRKLHGKHLDKFTPRTLLNDKMKVMNRLILDLLMSLDVNGLDSLKQEFNLYPDGELALEEFVQVMLDRCSTTVNVHRTELVEALIELFDSMDLDGNESLEFEEFLETVIHWGLTAGGGTAAKRDLDNPIVAFQQGPTSCVNPRPTLKKLRYVDVIDKLLIHEPMRYGLRVVDPDTLFVKRNLKLSRRDVTAMEYIHSDSAGWQCKLVAMAVPRKILFWEGLLHGKFQQSFEIPTRIEAWTMKHMQLADLLLLGARNGGLYAWNTSNDHRLVTTLQGHSCAITALEVLEGTYQAATGSIDRTVRLWDFEFEHEKHLYKGHKSAITSLAYSNEHSVIVSGSRDAEICIWSATDKHVLFRLSEHKSPIKFMHFQEGTPQFLSADSSGVIKIWDTRMSFSCTQTIESGMGYTEHMDVCLKRDVRVVIPGDTDLRTFDQQTNIVSMRRRRRNKEETHDWLVTCTYNEKPLVFVTATCKQIRFWNALTGCLKEEYDDPMSGEEVTKMCFDHSQRKLILGGNSGSIHVLNAMSGGIMKSLESHAESVIGLEYVSEYKQVISLGADCMLKMHDETPISNCPVRWTINLEDKGLAEPTCLTTSFDLNLCAVGDRSGLVGMWDLEVGVMVEMLRLHHTGITCIAILEPFPVAVTCDEGGEIRLWLLRPHLQHGECIKTFQVSTGEIISIAYESQSRMLFAGDIAGFIHVFDMADFLNCIDVEAVDIPLGSGKRAHALRAFQSRLMMLRGCMDAEVRAQEEKRIRQSWTRACFQEIRRFRGCDSFVCGLGVIRDPLSIFIRTFSARLIIVSDEGERLGQVGTLDTSRLSVQKFQWKFHVNVTDRLNTSSLATRDVMDTLHMDEQLTSGDASESSEGTDEGFDMDDDRLPRRRSMDNSCSDEMANLDAMDELPSNEKSVANVIAFNSHDHFVLTGSPGASSGMRNLSLSSNRPSTALDGFAMQDNGHADVLNSEAVSPGDVHHDELDDVVDEEFPILKSARSRPRYRKRSGSIMMLQKLGILQKEKTTSFLQYSALQLASSKSHANLRPSSPSRGAALKEVAAGAKHHSLHRVFLTELGPSPIARRPISPPFYDKVGLRRSKSDGLLLSSARRMLREQRRVQAREGLGEQDGQKRGYRRHRPVVLRGKRWLDANSRPAHFGTFLDPEFKHRLELPALRATPVRAVAERLHQALK